MNRILFFFALSSIFISQSFALAIDWHGVLGFDVNSINDFRRIDQVNDSSNLGNAGSLGTQETPLGPGDNSNANWQSYVFRLEPTLIINDASTIKGEITSGYARGGRIGDSSTQSQEPGFGNSLYPYSFSDGNDSIVINKLFMELYADTATYVIGRHSAHYGLGAVVHAGDNLWDRYTFIRDGITAKIKLGSFSFEPFWARVSSDGSLTKSTRIKEYGATLLYDNVEQDLGFGILFSKKKNALFSTAYQQGTTLNLPDPSSDTAFDNYPSLGSTDVTLLDIYFKKSFGSLSFEAEVPIISGEIGNVFGVQDTDYSAMAVVLESKLKLSDSLSIGIKAGKASGDSGDVNNFEAMYLNPNYQVANLLFRYNLRAISNPDGVNARNVYDSYINNATYARLYATYTTEKWQWDAAFIWARAEETAIANTQSYNHLTNKSFTAVANQEDDLGMEFDINFIYKWNNEITIGGAAGYLLTGDYFGFNNSATPNPTKDSYILQLSAAISF